MGTGFLFKYRPPQGDQYPPPPDNQYPPPPAAGDETRGKQTVIGTTTTKPKLKVKEIFAVIYAGVAIVIGIVYGWQWGLLAFLSVPIIIAMALCDL